jgi:hypothetical protein
VDDENFEGNDGYPRAVFTCGGIGSALDPFDSADPFFSQHTEVYLYSLWRPGGNPASVHDPIGPPGLTTPTEELRLTQPAFGPFSVGGRVSRRDAEPLTLQSYAGGRKTFVYYLGPPPLPGVNHNRLRRADALR